MVLPIKFLRSLFVYYVTPGSLSNLWSLGVSLIFFMFVQLLTGIILVTNYIPQINLAASSIEHLMRDVYMGWFLRYIHISGVSFYFLSLYIHIARGLNYGSFAYPRKGPWLSGAIIFYLSMLTAFTGYILPWGQMSFWAATVITNLLTIFPRGEELVVLVWGSPTISTTTLSRFFTIHFITPFLIIFIILLHIVLLHVTGSGNPNSRSSDSYDSTYFSPYYLFKDLVAIVLILILFAISAYYLPLATAHPDNYVPANPFVTPNHIVPEWYFLPAYAILRACATKLEGILAFGNAMLILVTISVLSGYYPANNNMGFSGKTRRYILIGILYAYILLMYLGACSVTTPFLDAGEIVTSVYFFLIGILYGFPTIVERVILSIIRVTTWACEED